MIKNRNFTPGKLYAWIAKDPENNGRRSLTEMAEHFGVSINRISLAISYLCGAGMLERRKGEHRNIRIK